MMTQRLATSSIHKLVAVLDRLGLSGHERLPDLFRATCQGSGADSSPGQITYAGRIYSGGLLWYEVCARCRRGPTPNNVAVYYWWLPKDHVHINIHVRCLTPEECAWVWTQIGEEAWG